jgi:hypothetical protein
MCFGTCAVHVWNLHHLSRNLRHLRLDLRQIPRDLRHPPRDLRQRPPKLGKNAKNAKFQDAASPKLSKNVKNAKFQDVARTWGRSQVIGVETCVANGCSVYSSGAGYDVYGAGPGTDGAGFILGSGPAPKEQCRRQIRGAGFGCVLEPAPFMSGTCTI